MRLLATLWLAASVLLADVIRAVPPAFTTKVLLRAPVSSDESKEAIVAAADFPPGSSTGRHMHPGDEYGTVLEGALEIVVDGQPAKHVRAGESYHNAKGVVHRTSNNGVVPARVISTFVIAKGQPVAVSIDVR